MAIIISRVRVSAIALLCVSVLFWPFSLYLPLSDIRLTIVFAALGGVLSVVVVAIEPRRLRRLADPRLWPAAAFAAILIFAFLRSPYAPRVAFAEFCATVYLAAMVFAMLDDTRDIGRPLMWVLAGAAAVVVVLMGLHAIWFKTLFLTPAFSLEGLYADGYSDKNRLAFAPGLLLPFSFANLVRAPKLSNAAIFFALAAGLLATYSRMGVAALIVTLCAPTLFSADRRKYVMVSVPILTALLLAAIATHNTAYGFLAVRKGLSESITGEPSNPRWILRASSDRITDTQKAVIGALEKPVFGHGLDAFTYQNPDYFADGSLERYPSTHNDYATALYELGAVGFLALLALFAARKKNAARPRLRGIFHKPGDACCDAHRDQRVHDLAVLVCHCRRVRASASATSDSNLIECVGDDRFPAGCAHRRVWAWFLPAQARPSPKIERRRMPDVARPCWRRRRAEPVSSPNSCRNRKQSWPTSPS